MNIKPLGNYILASPVRSVSHTGKIVIPESVKQSGPELFRVLDLGSKVKDLKIGDMILCFSYSAGSIPLAHDELNRKMITQDQVLAVIEQSSS